MNNDTGEISVIEPSQELIAMTSDPMIKGSEDSFSIEIVTSVTKNIVIGLAAMVFDEKKLKDWRMVKGWYLRLKTMMR